MKFAKLILLTQLDIRNTTKDWDLLKITLTQPTILSVELQRQTGPCIWTIDQTSRSRKSIQPTHWNWIHLYKAETLMSSWTSLKLEFSEYQN